MRGRGRASERRCDAIRDHAGSRQDASNRRAPRACVEIGRPCETRHADSYIYRVETRLSLNALHTGPGRAHSTPIHIRHRILSIILHRAYMLIGITIIAHPLHVARIYKDFPGVDGKFSKRSYRALC